MRIPKKARYAVVLFCILLPLLSTPIAMSESVVCPKSGITGFEREYDRAKSILPAVTTSSSEAAVYITKKGDLLYLHSNFKPGLDWEYPIKIATNDTKDLLLLTSNIMTVAGQAEALFDVTDAHKTHVKYYLDQKVFDSSGNIDLELAGASNLYVVFEGDKVPRKLVSSNAPRGPPKWFAEWSNSLFVKPSSSINPNEVFSRIESRSFNQENFRLISLFIDKAVENAITSSQLADRHIDLGSPTKDALINALSKNRGKLIGLLGHVENGDFVTRDPENTEVLLRISIIELTNLASKYNCDIAYLGCHSGIEAPVGVTTAFKTLDAIGQLGKALEAGPQNLKEFLAAFSSEKAAIVLDEKAFPSRFETERKTSRIDFTVFERERIGVLDRLMDVSIGFGGLLLAGGGGGGNGDAGGSNGSGGSGDSGGSNFGSSSSGNSATTTGIDEDDQGGSDSQFGPGDDDDGENSTDESETQPISSNPYVWVVAILILAAVVAFFVFRKTG